MVAGLDRWREYFSEYKDKYVLIGGAVCNASDGFSFYFA